MGEQEEVREALSFEQAMEQLEQIVAKLESGELPLEKALDYYQEGARLSRICAQKLEQVERKIEMVMESEQGIIQQALNPDETKGEII